MEKVNLIKQGTALYIKNLDNCIDDERLRKAFSPFGTVTTAKVMKKSGITNRFGFVCFSTPEQAKLAMAKMNGRLLGSLPVYVALAHCSGESESHNLTNEAASSSHHFVLPLPNTVTGTRDNQVSEIAGQGVAGPWWPVDTPIKENKAKNTVNIVGQEHKAPSTSSLCSDISAQGYSQKGNMMTKENSSCTEAHSYNRQQFPQFGPDAVARPILDCPPSDRYPVVPAIPYTGPFLAAVPGEAPGSNTEHQLPLVEQGFMMDGRYGTDKPTVVPAIPYTGPFLAAVPGEAPGSNTEHQLPLVEQGFMMDGRYGTDKPTGTKSKKHTMPANSDAPPRDENKYPKTVPSNPNTGLLPVDESRKSPKTNALKKLRSVGQKVNMNARYQTDSQSSTHGLPKPKKRSTPTSTAANKSDTAEESIVDCPPSAPSRPYTDTSTGAKPKEATTISNAGRRSHQGHVRKLKHKKNQQPSAAQEFSKTKNYVTIAVESNTRPVINWQSANSNQPQQPYTVEDLLNIQHPITTPREATESNDVPMDITGGESTDMQLQSLERDITARAILEQELTNTKELATRGALTVIKDSNTSRYVLGTDFSITPTLADQFIMSEQNNTMQRSNAENLQRELQLLNNYDYPPAQRMMNYNIPRPMRNPFYMQNHSLVDNSNASRPIDVINMQRMLLAENGITNTPRNNIADLGMYNMQEYPRNRPGIMQGNMQNHSLVDNSNAFRPELRPIDPINMQRMLLAENGITDTPRNNIADLGMYNMQEYPRNRPDIMQGNMQNHSLVDNSNAFRPELRPIDPINMQRMLLAENGITDTPRNNIADLGMYNMQEFPRNRPGIMQGNMQNHSLVDNSNALRPIDPINMQRMLLAENGITDTPRNNIADLGMYNIQEFPRNRPGIMQGNMQNHSLVDNSNAFRPIDPINMQRMLLAENGITDTPRNNIADLGMYNMQEFARNRPGNMQGNMQNHSLVDNSNALRPIDPINMQRMLLAENGITDTPRNNIADLGMYNMQEFPQNRPSIMQGIGNNFMPQPYANYMQQNMMPPTGHNRMFQPIQPMLNQEPSYTPMASIIEPDVVTNVGIGSMTQDDLSYAPNLPLAQDMTPGLTTQEDSIRLSILDNFKNAAARIGVPLDTFRKMLMSYILKQEEPPVMEEREEPKPIPSSAEEDGMMTAGNSMLGFTNNLEPVNMPPRLPVGEPDMMATPGNGGVSRHFTYQDPAKMPEFIGDGQGVIMAAQNSNALTTQESTIFHEQVANQGPVMTAGSSTNHPPIKIEEPREEHSVNENGVMMTAGSSTNHAPIKMEEHSVNENGVMMTAGSSTNHPPIIIEEHSVNENGVMMTAGNPTLPRTNPGQSSNIQVIPLVAQGLVLTGGNRTVNFQFTPNVRNAPRAYCYWQPAAPVRSENPESLTLAMLAAALPHERREMLGERLYPLVQGMYSDMAGKITGMLLGLDDIKLLYLLENIGCLRDKVDEAVAVLRAHEARKYNLNTEKE